MRPTSPPVPTARAASSNDRRVGGNRGAPHDVRYKRARFGSGRNGRFVAFRRGCRGAWKSVAVSTAWFRRAKTGVSTSGDAQTVPAAERCYSGSSSSSSGPVSSVEGGGVHWGAPPPMRSGFNATREGSAPAIQRSQVETSSDQGSNALPDHRRTEKSRIQTHRKSVCLISSFIRFDMKGRG